MTFIKQFSNSNVNYVYIYIYSGTGLLLKEKFWARLCKYQYKHRNIKFKHEDLKRIKTIPVIN